MKAIILLILSLTLPLTGTTGHLMVVKQPLFWLGSEVDSKIMIADVVIANAGAVPESYWSAVSIRNKPPASGTVNPPGDINLISLYGIKVSGESPAPQTLNVTIDASKAKVPANYPFTVAQVMDAAVTCVKMMHPLRPENQEKFNLKIIQPDK